MRNYGTLILSFICSVVIFIVLIMVQKQMLNNEEVVEAYMLKQDIQKYDNITMDMLELVKISNVNNISQNIFMQSDKLSSLVINKDITKGKILFVEDLIDKEQLDNYIANEYTQKVIIPISSADNGIRSIMHENSYINIYVTIDKEYGPENIEDYEAITISKDNKKVSTILYLEKVKPIAFLNEHGNEVSSQDVVKSVVVELDKKQAMYINYIKGKAGFNITAI